MTYDLGDAIRLNETLGDGPICTLWGHTGIHGWSQIYHGTYELLWESLKDGPGAMIKETVKERHDAYFR